jgi:hypothetical protein
VKEMSLPPDVTDYGPIVENAIAALAHNAPDARREVYARVRSIVMHHLRLSGQPDAIVELETLALDLAISKVERRWRKSSELPVRKPVPKPWARGIPSPEPAAQPFAAGGEGLGKRHAARLGGLGALLRPRAVRIGLAVALPIIVAAVFVAVLGGNNFWSPSLADRPKSQDRLLAGPEPSGSAPTSSQAAGATTSLGPTKVRPVRADFGAVP